MNTLKINEFYQNFASLFENTDPSLIKSETNFRELEEWDSLIALSLIALSDEEYQVRLTGDDIRNSKTVKDLFDKIQNKIS